MNMETYPNLAHRPARPALNRGRVQVACRRALLALGRAGSTSEVIAWTCARKLLRGRRVGRHDYRAARRALDRIADRVGRGGGRGRPILWKVKD
jgi:hypothetical protein